MIKNKRTLILFSTFGLLALIAISPSILAFSGTVVPNSIVNTYGAQGGTLPDIQYEDDDYVYWIGVPVGWNQYKILTKIYFPEKSDVGTGNELEMEFQFSGGSVMQVKIRYKDSTYDIYTESSTSWKTVVYDLDNYKIVDYVQLYNYEWWVFGIIAVDYMEVNY
jgi:hypothetical protein